jgi:hypothetical protein
MIKNKTVPFLLLVAGLTFNFADNVLANEGKYKDHGSAQETIKKEMDAYRKKLLDYIPKIEKRLEKNKTKELPSGTLSDLLKYAGDDPQVYNLFCKIVKESDNPITIKTVIVLLAQLVDWTKPESEKKRKKEEITLMLFKMLRHKYLIVQLESANILYNWGNKEEAYEGYKNILTKPDFDEEIEKEFSSVSWVLKNEAESYKRETILSPLRMVIKYNTLEANNLIRKVYQKKEKKIISLIEEEIKYVRDETHKQNLREFLQKLKQMSK